MTPDVFDAEQRPVLVLGVGNRLLSDDGVGLVLLERLSAEAWTDRDIEFVDGGTQGLALLSLLQARRAVLILDAVALGATPGTVHALSPADEPRARRAGSSHESNVGELLAIASLLGQRPPDVVIVGIEPGLVCTGIELSSEVEDAIPNALERARSLLRSWGCLREPSNA